MKWRVAEAKQRLSELLRRAEQEPQEILNRERLVAVVLGERDLDAFRKWKSTTATGSVAEALAEVRRICREEQYVLPVEVRRDRDNAVLWVNEDGPSRKKHARRYQRSE